MYQIPSEEFPEGDTKYRFDRLEPKQSDRDPVGVAALVLGLIAVFTAWNLLLGLIVGGAAIVLGSIGIKRALNRQASKNTPLAGLILGVLAVIITLALSFVFLQIWQNSRTGAMDASRQADANQTMTAVEIYRQDHNGTAPAHLADLVAAGTLSEVPADISYYRHNFDTQNYRLCAPLQTGFFKCESGACFRAEECDKF
jgi:hypothetical protein